MALAASLAWIALLSAYTHVRYLHRPSVPDEAYRETTSVVQNFGNVAGIGLFFALARRALKKGERPD